MPCRQYARLTRTSEVDCEAHYDIAFFLSKLVYQMYFIQFNSIRNWSDALEHYTDCAGSVSTWMGDRLGTPGAVVIFAFLCESFQSRRPFFAKARSLRLLTRNASTRTVRFCVGKAAAPSGRSLQFLTHNVLARTGVSERRRRLWMTLRFKC